MEKAELTKEQEKYIILSIKAMVENERGKKKDQIQAFMLVGAIFALDALNVEIPPVWVINANCGRTDRIFA